MARELQVGDRARFNPHLKYASRYVGENGKFVEIEPMTAGIITQLFYTPRHGFLSIVCEMELEGGRKITANANSLELVENV